MARPFFSSQLGESSSAALHVVHDHVLQQSPSSARERAVSSAGASMRSATRPRSVGSSLASRVLTPSPTPSRRACSSSSAWRRPRFWRARCALRRARARCRAAPGAASRAACSRSRALLRRASLIARRSSATLSVSSARCAVELGALRAERRELVVELGLARPASPSVRRSNPASFALAAATCDAACDARVRSSTSARVGGALFGAQLLEALVLRERASASRASSASSAASCGLDLGLARSPERRRLRSQIDLLEPARPRALRRGARACPSRARSRLRARAPRCRRRTPRSAPSRRGPRLERLGALDLELGLARVELGARGLRRWSRRSRVRAVQTSRRPTSRAACATPRGGSAPRARCGTRRSARPWRPGA